MRAGNRSGSGLKFLAIWACASITLLVIVWAARAIPPGLAQISAPPPEARGDAAPVLKPRIIIPAIGANASMTFPERRNIQELNAALEGGAVHFPGSALPGGPGNAFIFGHSTGLPAVRNRAYAVFNRLGELKRGDVIRIRSAGKEHRYRVTAVREVKADAATVALDGSGPPRLTLSTCNVFGAVDDRTVIEADFMGSYPLWSHGSRTGSSS